MFESIMNNFFNQKLISLYSFNSAYDLAAQKLPEDLCHSSSSNDNEKSVKNLAAAL